MAQTKLGLMYERGNGVPQDVVLAQKWYILGAANGDKLGAEHRDALAKQMTPAQMFQAQQRARESKPKANERTTPQTRTPVYRRSHRLQYMGDPAIVEMLERTGGVLYYG